MCVEHARNRHICAGIHSKNTQNYQLQQQQCLMWDTGRNQTFAKTTNRCLGVRCSPQKRQERDSCAWIKVVISHFRRIYLIRRWIYVYFTVGKISFVYFFLLLLFIWNVNCATSNSSNRTLLLKWIICTGNGICSISNAFFPPYPFCVHSRNILAWFIIIYSSVCWFSPSNNSVWFLKKKKILLSFCWWAMKCPCRNHLEKLTFSPSLSPSSASSVSFIIHSSCRPGLLALFISFQE